MASSEKKAKIPVTVVTGFLGAGKTTFVNHILKADHGLKIAVVENEYGEVGIDDALVMETKEEIFEMNNGCVCCTVRGDLIRILTKLMKRKNKLDAILIETTGLADPAPVAQTFFVDEDIKEGMRLDSILTLVDAKHIVQHLDEKKDKGIINESVQQVAFADRILLNKIDLVTPAEKEDIVDRIKVPPSGSRFRSLPLLFYPPKMDAAPIRSPTPWSLSVSLSLSLPITPPSVSACSALPIRIFQSLPLPFLTPSVYLYPAASISPSLSLSLSLSLSPSLSCPPAPPRLRFLPSPAPPSSPVLYPLCLRKQSINKVADIIETQFSKVELSKVLGIKAFDLEKMLEQDPDFLDLENAHDEHDNGHGHDHEHGHDSHDHDCKDPSHDHGHDHSHGHGCHDHDCKDPSHNHSHGHKHTHDYNVSSVGIQLEGDLDMMKMNTWLSTILQEKGEDLYRSKGILSIQGSDDKHVFQGVHMMVNFGSSQDGTIRPWGPDEKRVNKVVFIGKHLNREELTAGFTSCLAAS